MWMMKISGSTLFFYSHLAAPKSTNRRGVNEKERRAIKSGEMIGLYYCTLWLRRIDGIARVCFGGEVEWEE